MKRIMKSFKNSKEQKVDVGEAKTELNRNLGILEGNLNKFRSSSPEKWLQEVGRDYLTDCSDPLYFPESRRTVACHGDAGSNDEFKKVVLKTIAEDEDFKNQDIFDDDSELCTDENVEHLEEGIGVLVDRVKSLFGRISSCTHMDIPLTNGETFKSDSLGLIKKEMRAILEDYREFVDVSKTITSEGVQDGISRGLEQLEDISKYLDIDGSTPKDLRVRFEKFFGGIELILIRLKILGATVPSEPEKGHLLDMEKLDDLEERLRTRARIVLDSSSFVKRREPSSSLSEHFTHLEESDFVNLSSDVSDSIMDAIVLQENSDIFHLREQYKASLQALD